MGYAAFVKDRVEYKVVVIYDDITDNKFAHIIKLLHWRLHVGIRTILIYQNAVH